MGHTTKKYALPYPTTGDPADGPAAFLSLAQRIEAVLSSEINSEHSSMLTYVGGTSGYASMRAYVDFSVKHLEGGLKGDYIAADQRVTHAFQVADTALETKIEKEYIAADKVITDHYDIAIFNTGQIYNGVMIGSMAPIGVGETRDVSNTITIPGSVGRRIIVIECSGYWTQGYGDIQIKWDGDVIRQAHASDTNQSVHVSWAGELAVNSAHHFQMSVVGRGPNVSSKENNVLQLSGSWSYIQAHTMPGGGT